MASVEENWQTKRSTIIERMSFIFNTEILSDVKFVVPVSISESESKKVIPGHKFVLAISSPVFFTMFYGQMAENTDSIELPDCDYESLLELFRYLYSDEVKLSGSNVMQVLYFANKYMVPSLAEKCNEFLRQNLKASNVFSILPHVQKFDDKDLVERCWQVIEKQTEEALTSDEFVKLERSLVETVVKREVLNVKEVELFKAVDRWATKECERQEITPDGESKRRILGEDIVRAIRFPLMSQKEFASVVIDSEILTPKEVGGMMKYYSDVLTSSLPFVKAPRKEFRCQRFRRFCPPGGLLISGPDSVFTECINVSVNTPITFRGVQHFGGIVDGEYTVSCQVKYTAYAVSLGEQSGSYTSEEDETGSYCCFNVKFDSPVCLEADKDYMLMSRVHGPAPWFGFDEQTSVDCQGVRFTFRSSDVGINNRTIDTSRQFPALCFSLSSHL